MSGIATLADAITPHIRAVLIAVDDGFSKAIGLKSKLEKIGVTIEREVKPDRFNASSLAHAEIVVMVEGCVHQGTRDAILNITVVAGKACFTLNRKTSHDTWRRLEEYTKQKSLPVVAAAPSSTGPRIGARDAKKVSLILNGDKKGGTLGIATTMTDRNLERAARSLQGQSILVSNTAPPEYVSKLANPLRALAAEVDENPLYNTNASRLRELEEEWTAKIAEFDVYIQKTKDDAEAAEALYSEEIAKVRQELAAAVEARDENARSRAELLIANEAQETEIEGLQKELKEARVLGAKVKGGREHWENVYKKKHEDAEIQIAKLTAAHNTLVQDQTKAVFTYDDRTKEIESLKAKIRRLEEGKKGGALDAVGYTKIRAILGALEVQALTGEQAYDSIVRIAGGK